MKFFDVTEGTSPVILGQPHGGTFVPDDLMARLNPLGQERADTDWHITKLHDGLLPGVTVVKSNVHRYVIDANRDPEGASLYPGQNTTTLCPTIDFDGKNIWRAGEEPSDDEISQRRALYHAPYHAALEAQIARVKAIHGVVVLYECHSIRSNIPFLFDGLLPVFNIGSDDGKSCSKLVEQVLRKHCDASDFDTVTNGRFKGGWTTRHYAEPNNGVQSVQMELSQRAYMHEAAPWEYAPERANKVRPVIGGILQELDHLARSGVLND